MTLALATARLGYRSGVEEWLRALETHDVRALRIDALAGPAQDVGVVLRNGGVAVAGVRVPPTQQEVVQQLADVGAVASALRTQMVILSISAAAHSAPGGREAAAEHVARALHAAQREGMPISLRFWSGPDDLLDLEMLEWLLGDLPALGVWLDIPALEYAHRQGTGEALPVLAEALGPRVRGLDIAGAADGAAGGAHPEDGGPDWSTLWEILPRGATRVLDVDPGPDGSRLREALAWLRAADARS